MRLAVLEQVSEKSGKTKEVFYLAMTGSIKTESARNVNKEDDSSMMLIHEDSTLCHDSVIKGQTRRRAP
jgi:hypothetical protein